MAQINKQPRGVMQILPELRNGDLVKELTAAIQDMAVAVETYQKGGEITLKLKYKPAQGSSNAIAITDELKVKIPTAPTRPTLMFTDESGSLTRNDPNQLELQGITIVRHEPKPAADQVVTRITEGGVMRQVDPETGEILSDKADAA